VADWLEFHDSRLIAIKQAGTDVEIDLEAYVHRWDPLGDSWRGTGWILPLRMYLTNVFKDPGVPTLPVDIAEGKIRLDGTMHKNMVRIPFEASQVVELSLHLVGDFMLEVSGRGARVESLGDARYVEELPVDMMPDDD
jgi:hypothetical protein